MELAPCNQQADRLQKKEYAPVLAGRGASRGATCFCNNSIACCYLGSAVTGVPDSLIVVCYFCENDVVKWISLSAQPSRTDRRLSEMSEQVLVFALSIERDYTLMEKRVKQEVV